MSCAPSDYETAHGSPKDASRPEPTPDSASDVTCCVAASTPHKRVALHLPSLRGSILPPSAFTVTIENPRLQASQNFCLLLWLMNGGAALSYELCVAEAPFRLFKDRARKFAIRYQNYLDVSTPTGHGEHTLTDDHPGYTVSVFPQILQCTALDRFRMDTLLPAYARQFQRVFDSYHARSFPAKALYLRANVSRLLQGYVNDTLYDVACKWTSWAKIVDEPANANMFQLLLSEFWTSYFVVQVDGSLPQFARRVDGDSHLFDGDGHRVDGDSDGCRRNHHNCANYKDSPIASCARPALRYGVWVDTSNGILLFCNSQLDSRTHATPTLGLALDPKATESTVLKLLLFVNLCILECCSSELR